MSDDHESEQKIQNSGLEQNHQWRLGLTILLVGYWSALFISTHIPMPELGSLPQNSDKLMHFVAYAGLAFLLGARVSVSSPLTGKLAGKIFAITSVYAVIDELLQTIPFLHRTGDPFDALADCLGSVIGLLLLFLVRTWLDRKQKQRS